MSARPTAATVALLAMCTLLPGCLNRRVVPAHCVRIASGETLTGNAVIFGDEVREYDLHDRNGIYGSVTAENSFKFVCHLDRNPNP
jgi:hypothetical protein